MSLSCLIDLIQSILDDGFGNCNDELFLCVAKCYGVRKGLAEERLRSFFAVGGVRPDVYVGAYVAMLPRLLSPVAALRRRERASGRI